MHMSESDFDSITCDRTLCNQTGGIGVNEFCAIMTRCPTSTHAGMARRRWQTRARARARTSPVRAHTR